MLAKYGTFNLLLMKLGLVDSAHPIDFLDEYRLLGCILVMTLHFYPLLYLNLAAAISNVNIANSNQIQNDSAADFFSL